MTIAPMGVVDYDVVTSDQKRVGRVVGTRGSYFIVETGALKKSRHPLPVSFVDVDREQKRVLIQMSKAILCESPKVANDGSFDEERVAAYYGE
jgi:hypothetical protein